MKLKMKTRMNTSEKIARDCARRAVAASRAEQGWSWNDLSEVLRSLGMDQTPNNLSTKHSRGAYRVAEFLIILRALGVQYLDLTKVQVPGLKDAVAQMKRRRRGTSAHEQP
jgi:hypothetical protein